MKKIIRLTESDLLRLVKLVINEQDNNKKNVLFVGDSLSAVPGFTWNYILADRHPEWNCKHIAEIGRTTDWMLDNLKRELKNNKYDLVFIWGGMNDVSSIESKSPTKVTSIDTPINNLFEMANIAIANNVKPIIFAGYDIESVMDDKNLRATKFCDESCWLKTKKHMKNFQNILNNTKKFGTEIIKSLKDSRLRANDGIHIGRDGFVAIAEWIDSKL